MQTAFSYFEHKTNKIKAKNQNQIKLTDRDIGVLTFMLEMKFSTIEIIHQKFFSTTRFGSTSYSLDYTRQRISELIKRNLIQKVDSYLKLGIFQTTQNGYFYLINSSIDKTPPKPIFGIDIRTFDHDLKVSKARLQLETNRTAIGWISERSLSDHTNFDYRFPAEFRPDGIYTDRAQEQIAFELEIVRKSKERYQRKIKYYLDYMINSSLMPGKIKKVHFICAKETVLKLLKEETQLFSNYFKVEMSPEFNR